MKLGLFIGVMIGMVAANFIYQAAFCASPNWAIATERSWFQVVALLSLGLSHMIYSINH